MNKIIKSEYSLYIFFGVLTTLVYFITRFTALNVTDNSLFSVLFAQITAVIFAFFTNKIYVFKDPEWRPKLLFRQLFTFFSGRAFVLLLDISITYLAVIKYSSELITVLKFNEINYNSIYFENPLTSNFVGTPELLNEFVFAIIVQFLAIIINYIISKTIVFRKNKGV